MSLLSSVLLKEMCSDLSTNPFTPLTVWPGIRSSSHDRSHMNESKRTTKPHVVTLYPVFFRTVEALAVGSRLGIPFPITGENVKYQKTSNGSSSISPSPSSFSPASRNRWTFSDDPIGVKGSNICTGPKSHKVLLKVLLLKASPTLVLVCYQAQCFNHSASSMFHSEVGAQEMMM